MKTVKQCAWKALEVLTPDKFYLSLLFKNRLGYSMNWKNPKTFNQKLQWMKLYDRDPRYSEFADKVAVRKYVEEKIGGQYLIPVIGVYRSADEIDFKALPDQFVLKCNHGAKYNIICRDKHQIDEEETKRLLNTWLKEKFYRKKREYHYKSIVPQIICEQYMEDTETKCIYDYKVFMLSGKPYMIQLDFDRYEEHTRNIYDKDWNLLDVEISFPKDSSRNQERPAVLDEMLQCAEILADDFKEVRVDFYVINGKLYFGELTFFSGAGFSRYRPKAFEEKMGEALHIPELEQK